jgi:hypothetical protein
MGAALALVIAEDFSSPEPRNCTVPFRLAPLHGNAAFCARDALRLSLVVRNRAIRGQEIRGI